jgi:anaerobic ribonucleoside-triphosphate reductase activating protein
MRIAGAVNDSIVDGPGIRMTLFLQGCTHRCPGCQNPETHDFTGGSLKTVDEILAAIERNPLLDGITFSGGEPLEQAVPLIELSIAVRDRGLSIWCYTGYLFEDICAGTPSADASVLLQYIDVLVDGPFIETERSLDARWRGSLNQRVIDVPASLDGGEVVLLCS